MLLAAATRAKPSALRRVDRSASTAAALPMYPSDIAASTSALDASSALISTLPPLASLNT